jgi:hypothetical protein
MNGVVKVSNFDVHSDAPNVLYKPVQVSIESVSPADALAPTSTLKPVANAMEVYAVLNKHHGLFPLMVSMSLNFEIELFFSIDVSRF